MLLERDRELGLLDGLVQAAQAGESTLALVEGPAGIGKSQLLSMTRQTAAAAGSGSDGAGLRPGARVSIWRGAAVVRPAAGRRRSARPVVGGVRSGGSACFEPSEAADETSGVSFEVLDGLFWLTAHIAAQGPLLLVVDDLHLCDRSSLRFIALPSSAGWRLNILVATAARVGEAGADRPCSRRSRRIRRQC